MEKGCLRRVVFLSFFSERLILIPLILPRTVDGDSCIEQYIGTTLTKKIALTSGHGGCITIIVI